MATNSQQFGVRQEPIFVNEVRSPNLEQQIANLTQCVQTLATSVTSIVQPYGNCSLQGHATDLCPLLQDGIFEQANALSYQLGPLPFNRPQDPFRPTFNPFASIYNPRWEHHLNVSHENHSPAAFTTQSPSFEDLVKVMTTSSMQFQQSTQASINNLEQYIGQLALEMSHIKAQQSSKLSSHSIQNHNVSTIKLKSGQLVGGNHDKTSELGENLHETNSRPPQPNQPFHLLTLSLNII